jgi:hypothetical protein
MPTITSAERDAGATLEPLLYYLPNPSRGLTSRCDIGIFNNDKQTVIVGFVDLSRARRQTGASCSIHTTIPKKSQGERVMQLPPTSARYISVTTPA